MCIWSSALSDWRIHIVVVVFQYKALRFRSVDVAPQAVNLLLHFGVLGALADSLEIGFDLAFELQTVAPRTALEGLLHDVAPQLYNSCLLVLQIHSFTPVWSSRFAPCMKQRTEKAIVSSLHKR